MFKLCKVTIRAGFVVLTALAMILTSSFAPSQVLAATAPSLGTAASFAVLGALAVTNTGPSVITGDLGIYPNTASSVTGFFPPGSYTGTLHAADGVAQQAKSDVTAAYITLAGLSADVDLTDQDLGGLNLTSGVYHFDTSAQLTGTLTLNAENNPNSVFVFQIGTTLTTASNSSVEVINAPANFCNKYWQVGSSATLGTDTAFQGNILADQSITLNTGASLYGRAFALNAAVTMDDNQITLPLCDADLGVVKDVNNATPPEGSNVTWTITVHNYGPSDATGVSVADLLPLGVTWVSDDGAGAYNHGSGVWTIGALANGADAVLHITTSVNLGTAGNTIVNTATVSATTPDSNSTNNSGTASADVTGTPAVNADLGVVKDVNNATPLEGSNVTWTITVHNYGPSDATGVSVADLLPLGVTWVSDDGVGAYNHGSGVWTIGALANGADAVLHITTSVNLGTAGNTIVNTATVSATTPDSNSANNTALADVTSKAAPSALSLTPLVATNPVGSSHTVAATYNVGGVPQAGVTINFAVIAGPNVGKTGSGVTDSNGQASWTYPDTGGVGQDIIRVTAVDAQGNPLVWADATKNWEAAGPGPTVGGTISFTEGAGSSSGGMGVLIVAAMGAFAVLVILMPLAMRRSRIHNTGR